MYLFTWKRKGSSLAAGRGWHSKGGDVFFPSTSAHIICAGVVLPTELFMETKEKRSFSSLQCVLLQERARGRRSMPSSLETSWIYRKRVQVVTCRQEEHRGQESEGIFWPAQTIWVTKIWQADMNAGFRTWRGQGKESYRVQAHLPTRCYWCFQVLFPILSSEPLQYCFL